MYKAVKKTEGTQKYMESLELRTYAPTEHWEENTSFVSVVESKRGTHIVKHIDILVYFLQDLFEILFLFQNMRSLVLCWKICTSNSGQVQLSFGLLNR